tara:strand:+ start:1005 stop:1322 length:318 start_codon:yes stop_codon:yes gene_type:complete
MSHFAKLDNNIVTEVIVCEKDFINSGKVGDEFLWVQTSYSGSFRKNYASVGGTYDKSKDAFIAPKNYPSWVLVEDTCQWEAPTSKPDDGKLYSWDEDTTAWVEIV